LSSPEKNSADAHAPTVHPQKPSNQIKKGP
jgi:hypothetical protein